MRRGERVIKGQKILKGETRAVKKKKDETLTALKPKKILKGFTFTFGQSLSPSLPGGNATQPMQAGEQCSSVAVTHSTSDRLLDDSIPEGVKGQG